MALADAAAEAAALTRCAGHPHVGPTPDMDWKPPVPAPAHLTPRPVVVGFGPCGLFAALTLAQMGFRPIVLERGRTVRQRTKDTWGLWRRKQLHPESNVQFGEGGAGTFSDGKLYSQIKDPRHLGRKVVWVPLPLGATRALVSLPGVERLLGIPAESLDYFASPTTYDTAHTTTDLEGTGVACPAFETYADRLLDYMVEHPEIHAAAMV